jgi:hypothetical protein
MARRSRRTTGTSGFASGSATALPGVYEGPVVLSALLARAGSPYDAEAVADRFRAAQGEQQERSDVIPALFEDEPHFASPDEARRLYGNLFALWDRLARGLSLADDAPVPVPPPVPLPPPMIADVSVALPPRGETQGYLLPVRLVEAVWKHLDALGEREQRRLRDRFDNAQPNVSAWLDAVPLPDAGAAAAHDLAFESWAMFDVAFGDRVGTVAFQTLRAHHSEPRPLETTQPALAAYVREALDLVSEEDAAFTLAARAEVERVIATLAQGFTDALAPEDDA